MSGISFAAAQRHAAGLCRCRDHVEETAAGASGGLASSVKPFALPGTHRVYERDRPFTIEHIALDLALDVPKKAVEGTARLKVRRIDDKAARLELDAVAFDIRSLTLDGHKAKYSYDDAKIVIEVPHRTTSFEIAVTYRVIPKRGLYFLEPDEHVRERPRQVWSQCQDEDARSWIPCHDKPHVKQSSELTVKVPKAWTTLSNGTLISRKNEGDHVVFHWKQDQPHPSYLITLVAGDFAELVAENTRIPVTYLVPRGREADGWRTFGRTPEMIALFEKKTGIQYPWPKYAQVVVHDFIFGGMENTSATTMYEHILLDERGILDVDMDGLVAHELAHQWFGDFVTCRDWSEGWLNEGWATYMELVWKEEAKRGPDRPWDFFGRDEYDYAVKGELDIYLGEDHGRYRRPIVCRDYDQPIDLFDRHLYQKGALVLHTLRRMLGDEAFWRGVNDYLKKHAFGSVESRDFQRALEAASGKSLDRVFDTYVHGSGHPELEVSIEIEPTQVVVSVKQHQKVDEHTKLWDGGLTIDIVHDGKVRRETVRVHAAKDTFVFNVDERPSHVTVDPEGDLLATLDVKAPSDLLRHQLRHATPARARWMAAMALGKREESKTIEALAEALADEKEFWGVRAEAAEALGEARGEGAIEALRAGTAIKNPRIRRAIARALGKFRTLGAVEALQPLALADGSYLVQSDAARSLGSTRQGSAYDVLIEVLDRKSWADVARAGAADGLANLRDERAVPHLTARTAYGQESPGRRACLIALAKLDTSRKTRELLEERLEDVDVFVRMAAVRGLELLGDTKARPALQARLAREDAGIARRRIREALRDLTTGQQAEVRRLREELDKVQTDHHELKARLAKLEARVEGPPKATKPPKKNAPAKGEKATKKRR
ncbi:MAG: M1 family aminopeptidase [Polyangiales bacterium]